MYVEKRHYLKKQTNTWIDTQIVVAGYNPSSELTAPEGLGGN